MMRASVSRPGETTTTSASNKLPPQATALCLALSALRRGVLCHRLLETDDDDDRESVLFIGTKFSILYTSMSSPAEAAWENWTAGASHAGDSFSLGL
jgi:hypothetical protein